MGILPFPNSGLGKVFSGLYGVLGVLMSISRSSVYIDDIYEKLSLRFCFTAQEDTRQANVMINIVFFIFLPGLLVTDNYKIELFWE